MIGLIEIRINTKSLIPGCGHLCSSLCASLNASPCLARAYSSVCLCVQVCLCSPMPSARSRCKCASADKEPAGSQRSANSVCATNTHTLKQCSRHYTVHWPLHNCYMYITHVHTKSFFSSNSTTYLGHHQVSCFGSLGSAADEVGGAVRSFSEPIRPILLSPSSASSTSFKRCHHHHHHLHPHHHHRHRQHPRPHNCYHLQGAGWKFSEPIHLLLELHFLSHHLLLQHLIPSAIENIHQPAISVNKVYFEPALKSHSFMELLSKK